LYIFDFFETSRTRAATNVQAAKEKG